MISFNVSFCGKPNNYGIIDKYVSRSAQPQKEDFAWLKEQGITDVFNFRTMYEKNINFEEEAEVIKQGLKYHHIPSYTRNPSIENIEKFLTEINEIKNKNGKAHIHCKAGADRTGMYAFIYKMLNNIGTLAENEKEWFKFGHHYELFPNLIEWTEKLLNSGKLK
ncbi:tyrosine-protein phosphatase [bacterium]|nr:tyrosine-protein phosphatase [bacterium]